MQLCWGLGETLVVGSGWGALSFPKGLGLGLGDKQAESPSWARLQSQPPPPAASLTEAPSWLCFSPCFSNLWNGLKTAVAGPYVGVTSPSRGSLLPPLLQGPALCGACPSCCGFCPHAFLITGDLWAGGSSGPCAQGSQAACSRHPSVPPTQAFPDEAVAAGRLVWRHRLCDLRVRLPHLGKK